MVNDRINLRCVRSLFCDGGTQKKLGGVYCFGLMLLWCTCVFCSKCVCCGGEVLEGLDEFKDGGDISGEGTDGDVMVELSEILSAPMLS